MCNNVWSIKVFLGWTWSNVCAGGFNWFLLSTSDLKILISISSCFQLCYSQPIFQRTAWILANTLFYKVKGWTPFPSPRLTLLTRDVGHPLKLGTKIELVAIPSAATEEQNRHRNMEVSWVMGVSLHPPCQIGIFPQTSHPAMGVPPWLWSFLARYWSFGVQTTRTYLCLGYFWQQKSRRGMVLSKSFLWLKQ